MAWVKLTDDFTEHPKLLEAGPLAGWLWVSALAWSNRNGTDGRIPIRQIGRLATFDGIGVYTGTYSGDDVDANRLADVLVDVGLFEPVEGAFLIHDYAEYQLTTDELAKRREQKSSAGRKGADSRWHGNSHDTSDSTSQGRAMARVPVPSPEDLPVSRLTSLQEDDDVDPSVWRSYAEQKMKLRNDVRDPSRWLVRTASNARIEHGAEAADLLAKHELSSTEVATVLLARERGEPVQWLAHRRKDRA